MSLLPLALAASLGAPWARAAISQARAVDSWVSPPAGGGVDRLPSGLSPLENLANLDLLANLPAPSQWPVDTVPPESIARSELPLVELYLDDVRLERSFEEMPRKEALLGAEPSPLELRGRETADRVAEAASDAPERTLPFPAARAAEAIVSAAARPASRIPDALWGDLNTLYSGKGPALPSDDPALNRGGTPSSASLGDALGPRDPAKPQVSPFPLTPSLKVLESWFEPSPATPLAWLFRGLAPKVLGEILRNIEASKALKRIARAHAAGREPRPDRLRAFLAQGTRAAAEQLRGFYFKRRRLEGVLYESFASFSELLSTLRLRGIAGAPLRDLLEHTVREGAFFRTELNARTWRGLTLFQRGQMVAAIRAQSPNWLGTRLTLRLRRGDDVAAVARKYAMGRPPATIERYLGRLLKEAGGAWVEVPLEQVLPKSVGETLNRFEECTGPDCVSSIANVRRVPGGRLRYREIEANAALVPGDILLFDEGGGGVHVALVVEAGEGGAATYVYTKNGKSRLQPYKFQDLDSVESAYRRTHRDLRRRVFRISGFNG